MVMVLLVPGSSWIKGEGSVRAELQEEGVGGWGAGGRGRWSVLPGLEATLCRLQFFSFTTLHKLH